MRKIFYAAPGAPKQELWMVRLFNSRKLNCTTTAKKLHTTKQTVSNYANCVYEIPFMFIAAACRVFDLEDDPEEVYREIQEDRNRRRKVKEEER